MMAKKPHMSECTEGFHTYWKTAPSAFLALLRMEKKTLRRSKKVGKEYASPCWIRLDSSQEGGKIVVGLLNLRQHRSPPVTSCNVYCPSATVKMPGSVSLYQCECSLAHPQLERLNNLAPNFFLFFASYREIKKNPVEATNKTTISVGSHNQNKDR